MKVLFGWYRTSTKGMEAGAQAVMVSYNEIDGEPNAQSKYLLTSIPRDQVGGNGPSGSPW
jgi:beta-glucosidase-like glycosyl hydrolase